MKNIIVTTDFSTNSKAGLRFAIQLAERAKCHITFFHCIEVSKPTSWSEKKYEAYAKAEVEKHSDMLEEFVAGVYKALKMKEGNYSFVVEVGMDITEHVARYAEEIKADFICASTRGAGNIQKLFGTHASKLVTSSHVPVIIVPSDYKARALDTIWYSTDMENIGAELKQVEALAKTLKAKVSANHFNYLADDASTKKALKKITDKHTSTLTTFKIRKLELDHSLTYYIESAIKKEKPAMVALFTKQNRNWFSRLFLGSNSTEMSFATHTPLVIFRKENA